jgi:hypothetical protein
MNMDSILENEPVPQAAEGPLDVEKIRIDFPALHQKIYGKPLVYLDNQRNSNLLRL